VKRRRQGAIGSVYAPPAPRLLGGENLVFGPAHQQAAQALGGTVHTLVPGQELAQLGEPAAARDQLEGGPFAGVDDAVKDLELLAPHDEARRPRYGPERG
jgi:hypothetical protein